MIRSTISSVILICLLLSIAVLPAGAQDATPTPVPIGSIEETKVTSEFQRLTFIGMIAVISASAELDGSVDDPIGVFSETILNECKTMKEASAPDIGDEAVMLIGTADADDLTLEVVMLLVRAGDTFTMYFAGALVDVLGDFLPTIESIADRDPKSPDEWIISMSDLPAGFTVLQQSDTGSSDSTFCS